ncbi:IS630 family transposase [Fusobacterium pseudoperiodonticum]
MIVISLCECVRRHLTDVEVARVVQMSEEGMTYRQIGDSLGVSSSVVSRAIQRYREHGVYSSRHGGGRRRATTPREDRHLHTLVARQPFLTARRLRSEFQNASGVRVSVQTVRNRLHEDGLNARRPATCPVLTAAHRVHRLDFAHRHVGWTLDQWSNVLFTDESRFRVDGNDRRVRVWRRRGHRFRDYAIAEHDRWGGASLMVWGGISMGGRTELYVMRGQTMNAQRYLDNILRPIVLPYAGAIGPDFVLMDDNARPHRARVVYAFLEEQTIERMEWPAYSPDLNPIENVWDYLGKQVRGTDNPPTTLDQLEQELIRVWAAMTIDFVARFIRSMSQRCQDVIRTRGGHTRY